MGEVFLRIYYYVTLTSLITVYQFTITFLRRCIILLSSLSLYEIKIMYTQHIQSSAE